MRQDDTHYVITGATGWLGRASLGVLDMVLGQDFAARVFAFASKPGQVRLLSGRAVPYRALDDIMALPPGRYVFLHCAFLGKERVADLPLQDFINLNQAISQKVCDAVRRVGAAGIFVPSSGAVYGPGRVLETDIDKNPYGVMKRGDEERFAKLGEELEVPVVITRVFNVAGPYINKLDSYALGSILDDIRQDRPVRIRAAQPVIRSYVHVGDLIGLVLALLEKRETVLFDTAGEYEIEVGDLARLALEIMGKPNGTIERPALDASKPENRYVGDGAGMALMAARHGIALRPLAAQVRDTADFLAAGI